MQFDLGNGREYTANVRDVIVAGEDHYLMDADYSQIEYRAMAGEAKETSLINGWIRDPDMDVHRKTASLIFNMAEAAVSDRDRQRGKTQNFSLIYGQGLPATAEKLGVSLDEARAMRETYFKALPAIQTWSEKVAAEASRVGYSVTPFGRRRWIPELLSHDPKTRDAGRREAINLVIQGGCADLLKLALIRLDRGIRAYNATLGFRGVAIVMTIHDSIVVEAHRSVPPEHVYKLMHAAMVLVIPGWPPITIDAKCGYRYGSLAKFVPGQPFSFPSNIESSATEKVPVESSRTTEADGLPVAGSTQGVGSVQSSVGPAATGLASPQVLYMPIPQMTRTRQDALKSLITANPGPHRVMVTIAGHPPRTLTATTSLTPDDPRLRDQVGPYNFRWLDPALDPLTAVRFS
jgi:hypothetical protein